MIEIIPNWHPIFVHFTVALLSTAVGFFWLSALFKRHKWRHQWLNVAFWNLWTGTAITALTVAAGWYAFNTVTHDTPSHEAMIEHRNWALVTATIAFSVAGWSVWIYTRGRRIGGAFLGAMLLIAGLLLSTAWHGAELVYRHGLGVMSLPEPESGTDGHGHEHAAPSTEQPVTRDEAEADESQVVESGPAPHDDGHEH